MGTELTGADCSPGCRAAGLSNEGGCGDRFCCLKNIMGLWMIQSVKKEIGGDLGFGEICEMASKCDIASLVDCNDNRFLAPDNMTEEVRSACRETGQQVPQGVDQVAVTGRKFDCVHIVGGGSNAEYLNRLTARNTGLPVYAGPGEATAIGNVAIQMIAAGELKDLREARACVFESFGVKKYQA